MKKTYLITAAIAIALVGCGPSEMYPAGGAIPLSGGGSGGSSGSGTAPAPSNLAPMPVAGTSQPSKMLEDPDAEVVETSEEVWANNEDEATTKCQQIAEARTKQGKTVVTVQGRPQLIFKGRYNCKFRGET